MNFYVSSGLYSFLMNLAIGLYVYSRNPRKQTNILFALFSLTVSGWSVGSFFVNVITNPNTALFVLRFNYLFGVWLPSLYLHFIYTLTENASKTSRIKLKLSYLVSFVLSFAVFTPSFIPQLKIGRAHV